MQLRSGVVDHIARKSGESNGIVLLHRGVHYSAICLGDHHTLYTCVRLQPLNMIKNILLQRTTQIIISRSVW